MKNHNKGLEGRFNFTERTTRRKHTNEKRNDEFERSFVLKLKSLHVPEDVLDHLKTSFLDLEYSVKKYVQTSPNRKVEVLSEMFQNAYKDVRAKVYYYEEKKILHSDLISQILENFEGAITSENYLFLFCPEFSKDEESDIRLQERIRQLRWISVKHLGCKIDITKSEVRDLVYHAISELSAMDSFFCPQDKLDCTVRCCRHIFDVLKHSYSGVASADEFLPALIFIVIRSNPVRLHSNINYVTRFANASKLGSGESGYFFTNLYCAVSFIENINAETLSIDKNDFQLLMESDKLMMTTTWETALFGSGTLISIADSLKLIAALKNRTQSIGSGADKIVNELNTFKLETNEVLSKFLAVPLTQTISLTKLDCIRKNAVRMQDPMLKYYKCEPKTKKSTTGRPDSINTYLHATFESETSNKENPNDKEVPAQRGFSLYDIPSISCNTGETRTYSYSE